MHLLGAAAQFVYFLEFILILHLAIRRFDWVIRAVVEKLKVV